MFKQVISKYFPRNVLMCILHQKHNIRPHMRIMDTNQTISHIQKTACSIARFGDGEFDLLLSADSSIGFQANSQELVDRLKNVLSSRDPNLLVCIPYSMNRIWGRTQRSCNFWYYWCERNNNRARITEMIMQLQDADYIYGDSQVTRPYLAWGNFKRANRVFRSLKRLWHDKNILIVEGALTRLGVGNDLFIGARSIKRILAPATNAFEYLDEIRAKIEEYHSDELVILALGPTATVLAADLSAKGIQAIDIGHVDIEYEWYLRGSKSHELIPGKFTNEATLGNNVADCKDV